MQFFLVLTSLTSSLLQPVSSDSYVLCPILWFYLIRKSPLDVKFRSEIVTDKLLSCAQTISSHMWEELFYVDSKLLAHLIVCLKNN